MNCKDRLTHAILSHVEQYKLTTAEIVAHRFFSNEPKASRIKKAKSKLRSICSKNLLESHLFPSKKSRFYAAPGAKLEPAAINYDLAVLIWCNTPTAVRHRISHQDLKKLLPGDNTPHHLLRYCLQKRDDGRRHLLRIYPTTATKQLIVQRLRKNHIPAIRAAHLAMAEPGDHGVAVLVDCKKKKKLLEQELIRSPKNGTDRLIDQVRIVIDVVPTAENIDSWDYTT